MRRIWRGTLALAVAVVAGGFAAGGAGAETIYNNIPSPIPGDVPSWNFADHSLTEFGGEVSFPAPSGQKSPSITFLLSSRACQGVSSEGGCLTTKKHGFRSPMTVVIRKTSGEVIHTYSKPYKVPYRPSSSAICATPEFESPGSWYDAAENRCYAGLAFELTFALPKKDPLPDSGAIITIRFSDGSLGVGMSDAAPSIGADPTEAIFLNSGSPAMYCGDESDVGTFQGVICPSLFGGEQPAMKVVASH
jgi:hypothetical protein